MTMPWWIWMVGFVVPLVVAVLFGRRLRRMQPPQAEPAPRLPLDFPHVAPPMLHLLDKLSHRPVCGASVREAWTIEHEAATCPECRKLGDMAMIQWFTNTR